MKKIFFEIGFTLRVSVGISSSFGRYFIGTNSGFFGVLISFVRPPIETLRSFDFSSLFVEIIWEQGRLVRRTQIASRLTSTVDDRVENISVLFRNFTDKLRSNPFREKKLLHFWTFNFQCLLILFWSRFLWSVWHRNFEIYGRRLREIWTNFE